MFAVELDRLNLLAILDEPEQLLFDFVAQATRSAIASRERDEVAAFDRLDARLRFGQPDASGLAQQFDRFEFLSLGGQSPNAIRQLDVIRGGLDHGRAAVFAQPRRFGCRLAAG